MKISYTITKESATCVIDGKTHVVQKGAANFAGLSKALLAEDQKGILSYLTVQGACKKWSHGAFSLNENGSVTYKGTEVPGNLSKRITAMIAEGEKPDSLCKFWERLQANPSWRSVTQLFGFLANEGIPIEPDGTFLAYKSVKPDFKDWHSGTVENKIGTVLEMPRNQISDDPNEACHFGFHVGALDYAKGFGGDNRKIIIVRVCPEDVVCVPYDASQQKMRVCKYEVVGHYAAKLPSTTFSDDATKKKAAPKPKKGKEVKAGDKAPAPVPTSKEYVKLDKMSAGTLMDQSLTLLRKYAAHHLKIVGACKVPGGKPALIDRILNVRDDD